MMADGPKVAVDKEEEEKIPLGQVLLDDFFLLLALGMTVPLILYMIWGVFDLTMVPPLIP